jgi:hypothetical protein
LAYQVIKREPLPPVPAVQHNGKSTVFPKHVLADYASQWAHWWQEKQEAPVCDIPFDPSTPPVTGPQLREASAHFKASTSAPDGLPPRSLALTSDQCLTALATLLRLFEQFGWPQSECLVLTVLIPKKNGGLRPIALFRSLYRGYSKVRANEARSWAARPGKSSLCNNSSGMWVGGRHVEESGADQHGPAGPPGRGIA